MSIQGKMNIQRKVSMRSVLAFLSIIIINLPIIAIVSRVNFSSNSNWKHFKQYLLPDAVSNTLLLVIITLLLSGTIGVLLATAVALFDFPLKRFFEWVLYIPITIPPYIAAYVYAGMLSYTGIIQRLCRGWGISFPPEWLDIMNVRGAVFIYSITLYPYIYGVIKSFLENHSGNLIDTARVLGYKPVKLFIKVILPLIRIPLIGGLMLVMMEVVSDYGVIKYFNIQTVSSTIFNSWFGMGETGVSIRLSFYVMIFIIALQVIEEIMRGRKKYNLGSGRARPITAIKLKGFKRYAMIFFLILFITVAFLIPVGQMVVWAILAFQKVSLANLSQIIFNTLLYSTLATIIILILNILIAHSRRWMSTKSGFIMSKLTQLGYSMPGAIIAIGTITIFVAFDGLLHPLYRFFDPNAKKLLLSTSVTMLVFAFVVRYMAIGYNSVNSAFAKVGLKYNDAARTLGISRTKAMLKVELPMLKNSLIAGFILTFIDILKELPLTLLLRPFNYNTLASRVYEYANDERIHEASVPALIIIFLSILAVILLVRINSRKGGIKKK
ncbi:MAG: iron(III) transport system permease protein [Petroclostridium sp.]|jgi:iron(III) transport system permease protein|nr:iron(III) transport system permease protein [Petroclostridium sp.]